MSAQDIISNIEDKISQYHLLKHPFFKAWTEGRLDKTILQDYAQQYYHHVAAFPTYLSAVHMQTEDQATRKHLLQNLVDEEAGSPNHPELWIMFAKSLGVSETQIMDTELNKETQALISTFRDACAQNGPAAGIAALYAYESQIPDIAESKIAGLKKHYGLDGHEATEYFRVHIEADKEHAQVERDMMLKHLNPENSAQTYHAVDQVLQALWNLLSSFCQKHNIQ